MPPLTTVAPSTSDEAQSVLFISFCSRVSSIALSCTEAALTLPWPLKYCSATTNWLLVLTSSASILTNRVSKLGKESIFPQLDHFCLVNIYDSWFLSNQVNRCGINTSAPTCISDDQPVHSDTSDTLDNTRFQKDSHERRPRMAGCVDIGTDEEER